MKAAAVGSGFAPRARPSLSPAKSGEYPAGPGEGAPRTKVGTRTTAAVKDAATRVAI
jgi:hypothetical protein